jgi:hypothetical protein
MLQDGLANIYVVKTDKEITPGGSLEEGLARIEARYRAMKESEDQYSNKHP